MKSFSLQDIGHGDYFSGHGDTDNAAIVRRVAKKSYLPANKIILENILNHPEFHCAFSISGTALQQFQRWAPEVIESFRHLIATGRVELLAETDHHSLSSLFSAEEFRAQVLAHTERLKRTFGVTPRCLRNTELICSEDIAGMAEGMGFRAILAEGADHILGWRSPSFAYRPAGKKITLLLKDYKLSDDIAFRFGSREWPEWPLTAEKFASWIAAKNGNGQLVNLFMDYETFGEHQWEDCGIFEFLKKMPEEILKQRDCDFVTPSQAAQRYQPVADLPMPHPFSWADVERDLSAWRGNPLQESALKAIWNLEKIVKQIADSRLLEDWRRLTTSDHFYYMCTKWWSDGDVHKYFSPYQSPHQAWVNYMNAIHDLKLRIRNYANTSQNENYQGVIAAEPVAVGA